jgi:hypothetical protein
MGALWHSIRTQQVPWRWAGNGVDFGG